MALLALPGCAELDWRGNDSDFIGPARHLAPLPPDRLPPAAPGWAATQPATQPAPYALTRPAAEGEALSFTVGSALVTALENNLALKVDRINPALRRTFVDQERARFDPVVAGEIAGTKNRTNRAGGVAAGTSSNRADSLDATASATQLLPTGTTIGLEGSTTLANSTLFTDTSASSRVGLTATQALLRGAGVDVNLASLRQARVDVLASQYELRGFSESLVEQVENTYWDYALAQRQIEIVEQALDVARQQLEETRVLIRVGKLAEIELAAAEAEEALRKEDLINARSNLGKTRLALLRLLSPAASDDAWDRPLTILNQPFVPQGTLDPADAHVKVALRMRADLNQARLQIQRGNIELVRTRNGLLPKLDLFISLGKTGYANSFGRSVQDIGGDSYDVRGGMRFELPIENRSARAEDLRAHLTRDQAVEAVKNLEQLVQVDVRSGYIEVTRSREQIDATAATRRLQEQKLRGESEKFRVGKSTSLLVAQAQRDLLQSQISEIQAVVSYLKATVTLFRLEGSLLERRGLDAPGREPVDPNGPPPGAGVGAGSGAEIGPATQP
ncbi:MAG: TolC family protein [Planctomycetota bacterium]|nr:TolC family protein [Planctomycetota bacterium]